MLDNRQCPQCGEWMFGTGSEYGMFYNCLSCDSEWMSPIVLGRMLGDRMALHNAIEAEKPNGSISAAKCLECGECLLSLHPDVCGQQPWLFVCPVCDWIWVPPDQIRKIPLPRDPNELKPESKIALMNLRLELNREDRETKDATERTTLVDPRFRMFVKFPGLMRDAVSESGQATLLIVVLCVLAQLLTGFRDYSEGRGYLASGIGQGSSALWLIRSMFVHSSVASMVALLMLLLFIGPAVEESLGFLRTIILMLTGHLCGFLAYAFFAIDSGGVLLGMHQAVCSLIAFLVVREVFGEKHHSTGKNQSPRKRMFTLVFSALIWFGLVFMQSATEKGFPVREISLTAQLAACCVGAFAALAHMLGWIGRPGGAKEKEPL